MLDEGGRASWQPALDDAMTLRSAYAAMPGDDPSSIPWYVRLLENPASPVALPGAVDLFEHDCIHIVLGRGMLPQDEAFVLGMTMGASGSLRRWQQRLFGCCARVLYRGAFRFTATDRSVFDSAVGFAEAHHIGALHDVEWLSMLDRPLGELRRDLGIDTEDLLAMFELERARWPASEAAMRLPRPVEHIGQRGQGAYEPGPEHTTRSSAPSHRSGTHGGGVRC